MKLHTWILAASVGANAVLLAILLSPEDSRRNGGSRAGAVVRADKEAGDESRESRSPDAKRADEAAAGVDFVTFLTEGNAIELRDRLRKRGVSEFLVRGIVGQLIEEKYQARLDPFDHRIGREDKPYWQQSGIVIDHGSRQQMRKQMLLRRQMQEEIEEVVGPDPEILAGIRYGFLAPEKAAEAYRIEADYDYLRAQHDLMTEGFPLPSDRATLQLLEEEKNRDLAALMTPEERAAFELRTSHVSGVVRSEYGWLLETEEEYKQVLAMQQAFMDSLDLPAGATLHDRYMAGRAAGSNPEGARKLREDILEFLGPERAEQYARRRDPDYRRMEAATARLELPPGATERMFDIRSEIATESQRITADASLPQQQKQAALAELARSARQQLSSLMGPEAGQVFVERSRWVQWLEEGKPFAERLEGGVTQDVPGSTP